MPTLTKDELAIWASKSVAKLAQYFYDVPETFKTTYALNHPVNNNRNRPRVVGHIDILVDAYNNDARWHVRLACMCQPTTRGLLTLAGNIRTMRDAYDFHLPNSSINADWYVITTNDDVRDTLENAGSITIIHPDLIDEWWDKDDENNEDTTHA